MYVDRTDYMSIQRLHTKHCMHLLDTSTHVHLPQGTSGKESDRQCGGTSDFYTIKTNIFFNKHINTLRIVL